METVVLIAAVIVILALRELAPRIVTALLRWHRGRNRQVECTGCGKPLAARKAVSVGDTFAADDGGIGGTAVTTDWHKRCARKAGVA